MTREEFGGPWALLLAQPWGKPYRPETDRPRAQLQFELYWKRFQRTNPFLWQAVCEDHAAGKQWPSIDELATTIKLNSKPTPTQRRLPAPEEEFAPDDYFVRRVIRRWIAAEGSIKELLAQEQDA